ncbi:MAG: polyketide synthase dehydratase domain-containing protein [Phycisphaerae bacterium]
MLASVAGDAVVSAPTSPATASAPHDRDPVRRVEADGPMPDASTLAFSGHIERWVPGVEVEVHRELDLQEDLYLQDHCFDPYVSDADPHRERLSVVPLTVSLEMMAEVASLLMPGRVVVGAKQTMVGKWIDINPHESNVVLVITAKIKDDPDQVHVTIGPRGADQPVGDSTVVFADRFPTAPEVGPLVLEAQRPPRQSAEELYSDRRMFHGPRFRGVAALEAVGRNGLVAQLEVLPTDNLFKSTPDPRFHIDPFLLDAAGQLVGYWPIEYLDEGFVLFPIRIKEVIRYRRNLQPGQRAQCRLRVTQVSSRQLSADLDIIAPDGTLWMRIIGWEDWRFYWSLNFYDFWRYPDRELISESVVLPAGVCSTDAECRRMAPVGELGKSIWENLWAHMILSRRELGEYRGMAEGPGRTAWILGRVAAKDAVRTWVKRRCGLVLYPADVEVHNDQAGQPIVGGYWLDQVGRPPHLSISHKNTLSIALADDQPVGIDLEWVESRDDGFRALAFAESERALLESLNGRDPDEWYTRAWCGKEAAGKAMGTGLADGPRQMVIRAVDADTGEMHITCEQNGAAQDSAPPRREFAVHTTRDGDYVMAVALGIGSAHATT